MIKVERFINQLMSSNCYVVYDEINKSCVVIDPGSEKSLNEISFIEKNSLKVEYIIITHEHTDHNWGVNALRFRYPEARFVCSTICNKNVKKANKAYFLLYYDNPDYRYEIANADILIDKSNFCLNWSETTISFILTPGHSGGSLCVDIEGRLFTGDTIMPYKPYFNGRDSNYDDWERSVSFILKKYPLSELVYPGHGEPINLGEWQANNKI